MGQQRIGLTRGGGGAFQGLGMIGRSGSTGTRGSTGKLGSVSMGSIGRWVMGSPSITGRLGSTVQVWQQMQP